METIGISDLVWNLSAPQAPKQDKNPGKDLRTFLEDPFGLLRRPLTDSKMAAFCGSMLLSTCGVAFCLSGTLNGGLDWQLPVPKVKTTKPNLPFCTPMSDGGRVLFGVWWPFWR